MPEQSARRKLLELQFKGAPTREPLDFDLYAAKTEGLSGADIATLAECAKLRALQRKIENEKESVELAVLPRDLEDAIAETRPTVSGAMIDKYRVWKKEFFGRE